MQYIIDFTNTTSDLEITSYFTENNCTIIKTYNNFEKVFLVDAAVLPPTTAIIESIISDSNSPIQLLEQIPFNPYYLKPDPSLPSIEISTTDQKDWWKNYSLLTPDFTSPSVTFSRRGETVAVYIMDSGIEATHPEFVNSSIVNIFSVTGEYGDTNGHGTAIGSVISGNTCGLTSATLKIVKVFDSTHATLQSELLSAFDAILNDYLISNQAGVLNLSWTIPRNIYIENKIQILINAGILVVAAAGNSGMPIDNVTPAAMAEVLTIGSYNEDLNPSNFSNYSGTSTIGYTANETNSGQLDGWSPGENVWTASLNGLYGYVAGTSIATATHVCALVYNLSESLNNGDSIDVHSDMTLMQWIARHSLHRENLINLSDPKYSSSVNLISTIINTKVIPSYEGRVPTEIAVKVGHPRRPRIFNPQTTTSAELLSTLPAGSFFTTFGTLVLNPPISITEITEYNILIRVTSVDLTVVDHPLRIVMLPYTYNIADYPADDPTVVLSLQLGCVSLVNCEQEGCNGFPGTNCELINKDTDCGCV